MRYIEYSVLIFILIFLGLIIIPSGPVPANMEFCLGTGDVRHIRNGNVIRTDLLAEPYRTIIIEHGELPKSSINTWRSIGSNIHKISNQQDRMCQRFYREAAMWIDLEPEVGNLILIDVSNYVIETSAQHSLPKSWFLLNLVEETTAGKWDLKYKWKDDVEARKIVTELRAIASAAK